GKADVFLPPAAKSAISAGFGFQDGAFKHAELEVGPGVAPLPLPLWAAPPILLNRVGLAASVDNGFKLAGGVEIVAGASIAGLSPVSIDALPSSGGGVTLFIPKDGSYALISASGKVAILDIPIAYGGMSISTAGPLTFKAGADLDFDIISVHVGVDGGINLSNGDFYAAASGGACVSLLDLEGCAKVQGILSSIGFAACGSLEGHEKVTGASVSISLGYDRKWGKKSNLGDCAIEKYKPASLKGGGASAGAARAGAGARLQAPAGGQQFTLGGGDKQDVRVHGAGSRPGFTLTGPGGRTLTVPAGLTSVAVGANVAAVPVAPDTIELQVHQPAGTWTVAPAAGSTVSQVETAAMLPTPKIRASVQKTARGRQVVVKASNLGSQHLMIREVLTGGAGHELGTVKHDGTTTLRFTPADDKAGKRAIQAIVVADDGRQVASPQIATYTAPGPATLPAPRSVTLKRTKSAVSVAWKKVAGADHYRVKVTASDGRLQILTVAGKTTRTTVPGVTTDDNVQIKVSAVSKLGKEGRAKAATSKPTKKVAKTTPKKKKVATKK
ncbi:MAG: fibronectin type III domain-containing protein, partial [Solirubrobacteraceae bacterium]